LTLVEVVSSCPSGAALLAEAGGTMTDIHGTRIKFNQRESRRNDR